MQSTNRYNEQQTRTPQLGHATEYENNVTRQHREAQGRGNLLESRLETDKQNPTFRPGQGTKVFPTAKKSGRRSPGSQSHKKGAGPPKKTKPSVIEAMRTDDRVYMDLANVQGYQIHPKQQAEVLKQSKVREMLSNTALMDEQTQQVLARASAIQASINNSANMYSSIQSRATQAKLDESVNQIISSQKFENELKESIAQKIAKEITDNIKASYQNAPIINTSQEEEFSSSQVGDESPVAHKSASKKKTTKRAKLAALSKGTFSSYQKSLLPEPAVVMSEYTMQSDRQLINAKAHSAAKKKKAKPKKREESYSILEDSQMVSIDDNTQTDLDRSKAVHQKLIKKSITSNKLPSQLVSQTSSHIELRKKTKSQSTMRNPHLAGQLKKRREELESDEIIDNMSSKLNESAYELSEKMKMINMNDFYRLQSNGQDEKASQSLVERQQDYGQGIRDQVSPGVAPTATPPVSRYSNHFLASKASELVSKQSKSPKNLPNSTFVRHLKNKSSIIPEATEEYIQYTSNTPDRVRENERTIYLGSIQAKLQNGKKRSPVQQKEADSASKDNKKGTRVGRVKKSLTKKSATKAATSPLSGRSEAQGGMTQNRYYRNLGKRYVDQARSSSRGAKVKQAPSRNPHDLAKTVGRNAYDSKLSHHSNQLSRSQLNINDDFEMIERTLEQQNNIRPHAATLTSLAKPKQKRDIQASNSKKQAQEDKPSAYFQRKNSSPSPLRLRGLQQKYSPDGHAKESPTNQEEVMNSKQNFTKNQYLFPLETPEPKLLKEDSYEDLNGQVNETIPPSEGQAFGITTERRSPRTHQIDLNSDRSQSSGQCGELQLNKEPRRSRKDRSREGVLSKNRPMSHNVESFTIPKKPIQVYSNIQDEMVSNNEKMLEYYQQSPSEGEPVIQIFSNNLTSAQDATIAPLSQAQSPDDKDESELSNERFNQSKHVQKASNEDGRYRILKKSSEKKITEKKTGSPAQKKTALQQIFGSNKYQASSNLVAALQQSSDAKSTNRQHVKGPTSRALRTSFGQSANQSRVVSKQTPVKKTSSDLNQSKVSSKHMSQLKNQYVDSKVIQNRMSSILKDEKKDLALNITPLKTKKKTQRSPKTEKQIMDKRFHGMSDVLVQEQNMFTIDPYNENLSASMDKIQDKQKDIYKVKSVTRQLLDNQNKRFSSKVKSEVRNSKSELTVMLKGLTLLNFRETENVRKPQKYMVFSANLFRIVFELITKIDKVVHANQKTKKSVKGKVNRDLVDDIGSEYFALDEDCDNVDVHMAKRLQRHILIKAEQELAILNNLLPADSNQRTQSIKLKSKDLEREILDEWNKKVRPFLYQVNTNTIIQIQSIQKAIKSMIDFNSSNPSDLAEIEKFTGHLLELFESHSLLTQACLKGSGQTSTLFSKLLSIVHLTTLFMNRKTSLTLHQISQQSIQQSTFDGESMQRETNSQVQSSEERAGSGVQDEDPVAAVQRHSLVVNQWLNPYKSGQDNQSDNLVPNAEERVYGEVKYADTSIDIQLNENGGLNISKQNTVEMASNSNIQYTQQNLNKTEESIQRVIESPLDKIMQMRANSRKVFEYDSRSEQPPDTPCRDSLGFSIKLIQVELDSRDSGKLAVTGKGAVQANIIKTGEKEDELNNNIDQINQEVRTPDLFDKGSDSVQFALDQPGSDQGTKEGMRSIFNLREDELLEIMPTQENQVEQHLNGYESKQSEAIKIMDTQEEAFGTQMATLNPTVIVDDFAPPSTTNEKIQIVDDFNSIDVERDIVYADQSNKRMSFQNEEGACSPVSEAKDPKLEEDEEQEPEQQHGASVSMLAEEEVPEPKDSSPLPTRTEPQIIAYQSLESAKQILQKQIDHKRNDTVISQVLEEATEPHSPQDISSIIQRLQQSIETISLPTEYPNHKKRTSSNPYLSATLAAASITSGQRQASQEPMFQHAQENQQQNTQEKSHSRPTSAHSSAKKRQAKKKSQKSSIGEILPIQYGLYNPDNGIIVYNVDPDFDEEEDYFRIKPVKIVLRNAANSAMKTAGRRSPLTGSSAKNSSSRRSKASRQTNESSKQSTSIQNQLNVTRQKLTSNAVVRSRARPQRSNTKQNPTPGQKYEEIDPLEDVKAATSKVRNNMKDVEISPFGEQTDQSQISLSDAFQKVGDTTNPYSSNGRRDANSNDSRLNDGRDHLRKNLDERRRLRSQESQIREAD